MKFFKRVSVLVLSAILITGMFTTVYGASFTDTQGHWAENGINALVDAGILSALGRGDGKFEPDSNIIRAEFFAMLNNALGFTAEGEMSFSDVTEGDWFYSQIKRAAAAGYITGYEDNTIRPNAQITRNEAAVLVSNALRLPKAPGAAEKFTDAASIPAWALPYVESVVSAGLMGNYPDGSFGPARNETRAEAVSLMSLSMGYEKARYSAPAPVLQPAGDIVISQNYGPESGADLIDGNVTLNTNGITVKNLVIKGDLIIDAAGGTGGIILRNVNVEGKIIVRSASSVTYSGNAAEVEYGAANGTFVFTSGLIGTLTVTENAAGSKFRIDKGAVIENAEIFAHSTFEGRGEITLANIHARNVYADAGLIKGYAQGSLRSAPPQSGSGAGTSSGGGGFGFPFIPPGGSGNENPPAGNVAFETHVVAEESYLVPLGKKGILVFVKDGDTVNYTLTEEEAGGYVVSYYNEDSTVTNAEYDSSKGTFYIEVDEVEGAADSYYIGRLTANEK
ncbi:MAG: S-layer homology domain-containing protein [Clostridiales bacterium]|nr:S-layer homology domain-containing protein [Clostridiales bacterium]